MTVRLVSVIIPCYNVQGTIRRLVLELLSQELPRGAALEIIAVDNCSTDGTLSILRSLPVKAVSQVKVGPAAARNAGLRIAAGEVILFLDADTRPMHKQLITEHLDVLEKRPEVGISGGPIVQDTEQNNLLAFAENATALFNWHHQMPAREITFQPSGNMAFRRSLYELIGPMDESLLTLEDFEWNQRVLQKGFKVYFNPLAGVYITGRECLIPILAKFYAWGIHIRKIYLPGRRDQLWLFPDHPRLFYFNVPYRMINETWVTVKRWFPVYPLRTVLLIPLFLLYRAAWAAGMASGIRRYGGKS